MNRVGGAWSEKRRKAITDGKPMTRKLPGWLQLTDGKITIIPAKRATVERLFRLAADGNGVNAIASLLNSEKVPTLGAQGKRSATAWTATVVYHVLTSRATIGEFQPHVGRGRDRKPFGEPLKNYFPAVVSQRLFWEVQQGLAGRGRTFKGKRGNRINLFAGILKDARSGSTFTARPFKGRTVFVPVDSVHAKGAQWCSFPAAVLEDAILSELAELKPSDVLPESKTEDKVATLSAQVEDAENKVKFYKAKCDEGDEGMAVFGDKAIEWERKRRKLSDQLANAQREAASPVAEAWGQFRSVVGLLATNPDETTRMRVREALRRIVSAIYMLIISDGRKARKRLALVQVFFKCPEDTPVPVRSYAIDHWGAGRGVKEEWNTTSVKHGWTTHLLSDKDEAAEVESIFRPIFDMSLKAERAEMNRERLERARVAMRERRAKSKV